MEISEQLSIPAYLLVPQGSENTTRAVLAIHGHGTVEPCIGASDDYHHSFALELARKGYLVLCPELRGFGTLRDVAAQIEGGRLDYWNWGEHMAYSLVSDGIIHGKPLIGETVEDLLRWENWLVTSRGVAKIGVAGISYGGDLALIYPVFSERVDRIFASGTLGSFSVIFSRCYNAPAHGIPGVLQWMDRSDIAGLNSPRSLAIHYGELDTPGPTNFSASYNETVPESLQELRAIYGAFHATEEVHLVVSKGKEHEMDNEGLLEFLKQPIEGK
jgi:dienelactone hydrolase